MNRRVFRGVAATEVVGGVIGLALGVVTLTRTRPAGPLEGAVLAIGFLGPFALHLAAGAQFAILRGPPAVGAGINLVALALLVLLVRARRAEARTGPAGLTPAVGAASA